MPSKAPVDHQQAVAATLAALTCGQPRCRCAVAERRGRGRTHCPYHQDVTPSFGVDIKDGVMLAHCYAGCEQTAVVEALKARGLWPEEARYGQDIVAEYDYRDASGKLLYQSLRYAPKDFKQRRPGSGTGKNAWIWSLGDTPRVPYRLPDLLTAMAADPDMKKPFFIVEGEKDVDRMWLMELPATTNVGGAGKWRRDYAEYFKGRIVVIIVDRDDSGMVHGKQIAASLHKVAKAVLWLELPGDEEHGDVSDWLDDGGTREGLLDLARHAPKPPVELQPMRETTFTKRGLAFVYEPADAPITMQFSRLTDRRDETTAEIMVARLDGRPLLRRRLNLLGASGIPKNLIDVLEGAQLGVDADQWNEILGVGFEHVLSAHRNGLVLERVHGDLKAPAPVSWLCGQLVMQGKLNCWLGAAGTGKSTLAKSLCVHHATGNDFVDRRTTQGVPLYLDWEDDREDFERVAHDVCRTLGVWPVPDMGWVRMRGKRLRDSVDSLTKFIEEMGATLLVVDSIAGAGGAAGEHRTYEDLANELDECIGQLPPITVLGLDHITSEEHKLGKRVPMKARGSERKVEIYRNQWTLMADSEEGERGHHIVNWFHTKLNAGAKYPPFTVEIQHQAGRLSVLQCDQSASPEAMDMRSDQRKVEDYIEQNPGATLEDVCRDVVDGEITKARKDAVRKAINRAVNRERVRVKDRRYWWDDNADKDDDIDDDDDDESDDDD